MCLFRESKLYIKNAQKEHNRAFFVCTLLIWASIPAFDLVGAMSQLPHLYSTVSPQTNVYWFFYNNVTLDCPHIHWLLLVLHLLLNRCWGWGWSWGGCGMCLHILKQLGQLPYTPPITRLLKLHPALCHKLVVSGYCTNSCKLQKVHVFLMSLTCVPFQASHCIHCIFNVFDMNSCSTVFDLNPPVIIFRCLSLASL